MTSTRRNINIRSFYRQRLGTE